MCATAQRGILDIQAKILMADFLCWNYVHRTGINGRLLFHLVIGDILCRRLRCRIRNIWCLNNIIAVMCNKICGRVTEFAGRWFEAQNMPYIKIWRINDEWQVANTFLRVKNAGRAKIADNISRVENAETGRPNWTTKLIRLSGIFQPWIFLSQDTCIIQIQSLIQYYNLLL